MEEAKAVPPELLKNINRIHIRTSKLVNARFAGEYTSAFKGRGMEFEEVREYIPGDDVRKVDWNVTARMARPFVKEFREERELNITIMVDVSSSMDFGTIRKLKREIAAEAGAILACSAMKSNDRVGLLLFSEDIERYIPPRKGRGHVWRVVREVLQHRGRARRGNLDRALEFLLKVTKKRGVVCIISDFLDEGFERNLSILAKKHDVILIIVRDRREYDIPASGWFELFSPESGTGMLLNTYDRRQLKRGIEEIERFYSTQEEFFIKKNIDFLHLKTDSEIERELIRFFMKRGRRLKR